jgi:hypothetical protein
MMKELQTFVFTNENKGRCLKAYLMLAMGEAESGIRALKDYVEDTKNRIATMRVKNPKVVRQFYTAEHILAQC